MANFREMYDSMTNPLDDESIIQSLVSAYADDKHIYSFLTKVNVEQKQYKGQYYPHIRDEFYAKLFKIWKENVLSLTDNQVNWLIQHNSSVGQDYHQLRTYLRTLPEIKTKKEFLDLVYQKGNDLIEKYGWQSLGEYSGWTHVSSRHLTARKEAGFEVEHRLYLNTESTDTELVASMFVDKCREKNLPFYFKYDEFGNRDDTIVVYSDTEHLDQYISILRELKKENEELFSRAHKPPVLTGKIDGWIGYGAEPQLLPNGERTSFNEVRSKAIEKAIRKSSNNWINAHQSDLIQYQGQRITLAEYISIKVTEKVMKRYSENIQNYVKKGKQKEFYQLYGLVENDFNTPNLKNAIKHYVDKNVRQIITDIGNGKSIQSRIDVNTREGKKIAIYDSDFTTIMRQATHNIVKHDPNFIRTVTQAIKQESRTYGIDTDKFCFDIASRDKLFAHKEPEKAPQPVSQPATSQRVQPTQVKSEQKKQVDTKDMDVQTICDTINPALMQRKMKYPNGAETSAKQYIQEYLYPLIPEDGFFTLKNGARIPYKQYIEEFVMFEGQTKYNGDIVRLIEATTKRNQGLVSLGYGDEPIIIKPVEITDYLNPALMERKMKYPNGTETSAVQYIQEYFAPFIPESGFITLKNGANIPVKQYIEEVVMFEGQTKYNGDVGLLLQATTRQNHGKISFDQEREYERRKQIQAMLENSEPQISGGMKR